MCSTDAEKLSELLDVVVSLGCCNKMLQTEQLKQQMFSSGGRKSKVRGSADLMSGEASLPGLHKAPFLLYPHISERKRKLWSPLLLIL